MTGGCGIALKHQIGFDLRCFALLRYVFPWHCVATSVLPFASSLCSAYFASCFALLCFGLHCVPLDSVSLLRALLCLLSYYSAQCASVWFGMCCCFACLHCIALLCFGGFARQVPGKPPGLCRKPSVLEKPCVFKERR